MKSLIWTIWFCRVIAYKTSSVTLYGLCFLSVHSSFNKRTTIVSPQQNIQKVNLFLLATSSLKLQIAQVICRQFACYIQPVSSRNMSYSSSTYENFNSWPVFHPKQKVAISKTDSCSLQI